ncbi:MAG: class I SAM-dependent methyltransferase [Gammaproteobacteria bacterium]
MAWCAPAPTLSSAVGSTTACVSRPAMAWTIACLAEGDFPEVIYLDPMYPERSKAALVKKESRVLRELVGPDDDAARLPGLRSQACAQTHRRQAPTECAIVGWA